eukprot:13964855-Alexandrium_andersonii.AAC.2
MLPGLALQVRLGGCHQMWDSPGHLQQPRLPQPCGAGEGPCQSRPAASDCKLSCCCPCRISGGRTAGAPASSLLGTTQGRSVILGPDLPLRHVSSCELPAMAYPRSPHPRACVRLRAGPGQARVARCADGPLCAWHCICCTHVLVCSAHRPCSCRAAGET